MNSALVGLPNWQANIANKMYYLANPSTAPGKRVSIGKTTVMPWRLGNETPTVHPYNVITEEIYE